MGVALNDYRAALDYLFARTTGAYKFGLERTEHLLRELDAPHRAYPVLHVAGTNGKGSAVATAAALLRARGLRVATYTSPHLVDFRERIAVGGVPISPERVTAFVAERLALIERIGASFFEATTALAFLHFAVEGVDVAVIETGLGGRLDATNVVTPLAAGVTAIGYDHVEYLGETLEAIAEEKAGIFKEGRPAVIGERDPRIAAHLAEAARRHGSAPVRVVQDESTLSAVDVTAHGTRFRLAVGSETAEVETPLVGRHQAANFAFTLTLLDAAGPPFRIPLAEAGASVRAVRLPGRFERIGRWIFDVAHNVDGARTLAATLRSVSGAEGTVAVVCVLADKDWRAMLDALAPVVERFVLTDAPSAPPNRSWSVAEANAYARRQGYRSCAEPDFDRAIGDAVRTAATVLVTGSFHTVGDAMARLAVAPLGG